MIYACKGNVSAEHLQSQKVGIFLTRLYVILYGIPTRVLRHGNRKKTKGAMKTKNLRTDNLTQAYKR